MLLQVPVAAAADGLDLPELAAAAARRLADAAASVPRPRGGAAAASRQFDCVRAWCSQRGGVDAAEWGEALAAALAALQPGGGKAAEERAAVQAVPVSSIWVCGEGAEEVECCLAVEALLCG